MKAESVVTTIGEHAIVHRDEFGNIACPICGFIQPDSSRIGSVAFLESIELCPSCYTEIGNEDIDVIPPDPSNPILKRWAKIRNAWLEKEGWKSELLERIASNLGIDVDPK